MSKIVQDCQLNCLIHRYTDIVFKPYSKNVPKIPHNVINTFPGFKYMDYVPEEIINVEGTTLINTIYIQNPPPPSLRGEISGFLGKLPKNFSPTKLYFLHNINSTFFLISAGTLIIIPEIKFWLFMFGFSFTI